MLRGTSRFDEDGLLGGDDQDLLGGDDKDLLGGRLAERERRVGGAGDVVEYARHDELGVDILGFNASGQVVGMYWTRSGGGASV